MKYYYLKKCSYCKEMCERTYDIKKVSCIFCSKRRSIERRKLNGPQQPKGKLNMKLAKLVFWDLYNHPNCYSVLSEKYDLNYKEIVLLQEKYRNYMAEPIYNNRESLFINTLV